MLFTLSCSVRNPARVFGNASELIPNCVLSATLIIRTDNVSSNWQVSMASMSGERTLQTCLGSRLCSFTFSSKRFTFEFSSSVTDWTCILSTFEACGRGRETFTSRVFRE